MQQHAQYQDITSTSRMDESSQILQIVTTRFMQNQAQFLGLGHARYRLFETFCFPSMQHQWTSNFIWIILTDPDLDPGLLEPLRNLLMPYPNFYLVSYNDQLTSHDDYETMATEGRFLTGDIEALLNILDDRNRKIVLETRLDADDALDSRALLDIQQTAMGMSSDYPDGWQVICNNLHYEWRNPQILALNRTVEDAGRLRVVKEQICVTPGYTLVKHRVNHSVSIPDQPRVQHHLVTREWPQCGYNATSTFGGQNETITNALTNCWTKLDMYPSALRCRTITSAGMSRIETSSDVFSLYDNQTEIFWGFVSQHYGISRQASYDTSLYLQQNLQSIVYDNLMGQW